MSTEDVSNTELLQAFVMLQKYAREQHRKKIDSKEYEELFIATVCGEQKDMKVFLVKDTK